MIFEREEVVALADSNGGDPAKKIEQQIKLLLKMIESLQKQIDLQGAENRELRIRIKALEKQVEALKKQLQSPKK
jgi:peptidoglycan hydrolase CwlO-like protein